MNLSKNELKEIVQESYFEVMMERAKVIDEMNTLAFLGEYMVNIGVIINEEIDLTDTMINETNLSENIVVKGLKGLKNLVKKNPKLAKYGVIGGGLVGGGKLALDWTKDNIANLAAIAAGSGAVAIGGKALRDKKSGKQKSTVKQNLKKNLRKLPKDAKRVKKGAKYAYAKGKDLASMTKKEYEKYVKAQKKANKQSGQMEIPFESIQRYNEMSFDEKLPLMAIGLKSLDIMNETNNFQIPALQENEQYNEIENIILHMEETHKFLSENIDLQELGMIGRGLIGGLIGGGLGKVIQSKGGQKTLTKMFYKPSGETADGKPVYSGDSEPKSKIAKGAADVIHKINPTTGAIGGAAIGALTTKKKKKEEEGIEEFKMFGAPVPPQTYKIGIDKIKKLVNKKKSKDEEEVDEVINNLKELQADKVDETISRKVTIREVQRWMKHLEENKYKRTYINDCKRVAWLVNNKLSEDYSAMPAAYRRKREGMSYARERFLAKEFIKHINSKQIDEEV